MALWTYEYAGVDLNNQTTFSTTEVPQIDDLPPGDNILVTHAGDWPDFVRWQPTEGLLTVNFWACGTTGGNMRAATEAEWATRMATLHAAFTPGLHPFIANSRGWNEERQVLAAYRSMATNFRLRQISLELVVPKPVWE